LRHISYAGRRLKFATTANDVPEIIPSMTHFGKDSLARWEHEMEVHNRVLQRGERMRLCPSMKTKYLQFSSVDEFILRMHPAKVASILNSLSDFANKLISFIDHEDEDFGSCVWINEDLLVHRHHWLKLCKRVFVLLEIIVHGSSCRSSYDDKAVDGRDELAAAVDRAVNVFQNFVQPDASGDAMSYAPNQSGHAVEMFLDSLPSEHPEPFEPSEPLAASAPKRSFEDLAFLDAATMATCVAPVDSSSAAKRSRLV